MAIGHQPLLTESPQSRQILELKHADAFYRTCKTHSPHNYIAESKQVLCTLHSTRPQADAQARLQFQNFEEYRLCSLPCSESSKANLHDVVPPGGSLEERESQMLKSIIQSDVRFRVALQHDQKTGHDPFVIEIKYKIETPECVKFMWISQIV